MNKTRMLELADAIEAAPKYKFDMNSFVGKFRLDRIGRRQRRGDYNYIPDEQILSTLKAMSCGTSACIAGWAVHLHPRAAPSAASADGYYSVSDHAQAILGLTGDEAYELFHNRMRQDNKQAAAFIRRCVDLGTVPG